MANLANLIVRGLSRLGNVVASKVTADEFVGDLTGNADTATNASKVNNHTVNSDVPANAKFTDTTYTPASASPLMDGTAAVGTSAKYAREDHVHPSDTSRVPTSRKVNNKALSADITLSASDVSAIPTSQKGANSGVAELDANGKVPSSQLPSYVDDVLEYSAKSSFPATGETGKIYVDTGTNLTYRWGGSAYVEISPSLALGTTSSTAYRGDYGNTAYTHATDSSRLTTAKSSAFYKFATTAQGHVASVTAVTKADITGLGIPGSDTNTTYTFENGTNGFKVTPSGGSAQTVTVTPSITNNVTGSGTSGYLAKFNGANTITSGPQLGSSTTTYLRNDGTWATPPNDNTDTKVTQTIASDNANYRVLFSATADNTTRTEGAKKDGDFYYNPSTNKLYAGEFTGSVRESTMTWGDKQFTGTYHLGDVFLNGYLRANRFAGLKAKGITIEYSTDAGSTWTAYSITDINKRNLFTGNGYGIYVGGSSTGTVTANNQLRVTVDTGAAEIYTNLRKFQIYISSNYSQNCKVTIKAALQSAPTNYTLTICENMAISGWSGWNVIPCDFVTYGNASGSQYGRIQFTFTQTGLSDTSKKGGLQIQRIYAFGGVGWTTPSIMALSDHAYTFDGAGNVTFPAEVTATDFNGRVNGYTIAKSVPSDAVFTDNNNAVTQTATTTNADYEVLFSATADNTTRTEGSRKNSNLKFNPSTGNLQVTQINGVTVGSSPKFTDNNTTYSAGTGLSLSSTTFNHSNSVTAGTAGTSSATSGSTLAVPYVTYDAQGHVTASGTHTHTVSGFLTAHQTIKQDGVTGATVNRYGACTTAAGTAAKAVSVTTGTFSLEAGARVSVKFNNANTANSPTLNVNSKGAKNIFHKGAQITSGSNKALLAGICDFIYDGTQWHLVGNYIDTDNNTTYGLSISGHTVSIVAGGTTSSVTVPDNNTTYTANNENIGSASAGTAIPADDITAWSAGTMFSASASEGVVTFSAGTVPSLSYTAKSIPNISVTTKSVTTSITAS